MTVETGPRPLAELSPTQKDQVKKELVTYLLSLFDETSNIQLLDITDNVGDLLIKHDVDLAFLLKIDVAAVPAARKFLKEYLDEFTYDVEEIVHILNLIFQKRSEFFARTTEEERKLLQTYIDFEIEQRAQAAQQLQDAKAAAAATPRFAPPGLNRQKAAENNVYAVEFVVAQLRQTVIDLPKLGEDYNLGTALWEAYKDYRDNGKPYAAGDPTEVTEVNALFFQFDSLEKAILKKLASYDDTNIEAITNEVASLKAEVVATFPTNRELSNALFVILNRFEVMLSVLDVPDISSFGEFELIERIVDPLKQQVKARLENIQGIALKVSLVEKNGYGPDDTTGLYKEISDFYQNVDTLEVQLKLFFELHTANLPPKLVENIKRFFNRIKLRAATVLEKQKEEDIDIYLPDIINWINASETNLMLWQQTRLLWGLYKHDRGGITILPESDRLQIDKLLQGFNDLLDVVRLDKDVARIKRIEAIKIQIARLKEMKRAFDDLKVKEEEDEEHAAVLAETVKPGDKPVSDWSIAECVAYIKRSGKTSIGQGGDGIKVYDRYKTLLEKETPKNQAYWKCSMTLYDLSYSCESANGNDFSIDLGKLLAEGVLTTKGVDRKDFFEGILFHPEWGAKIRKIFNIVIRTLSYDDRIDIGAQRSLDGTVGTKGSVYEVNKYDSKKAASLNPSNVDSFEAYIHEEFLKSGERFGDGPGELPEHIFFTAMSFARVFDFRSTAFLEFARRGTTRGFGGEDLFWLYDPFTTIAYYLQRYSKIVDAKSLLLLLGDIPNSWIEGATDEEDSSAKKFKINPGDSAEVVQEKLEGRSRRRKSEIDTYSRSTNRLRKRLKMYFNCVIDVEHFLRLVEGFKIREVGSIFPTLGEFMYPWFYNEGSDPFKESLKPDGIDNTEKITPMSLYIIAKGGWQEVLTALTNEVKPNQNIEQIIEALDKFNSSIGKAKMVKGFHLDYMKYFAFLFYVRQFISLGDPSKFMDLRQQVLEKLSPLGGAAGVPADVRIFLYNIISADTGFGVKHRRVLERTEKVSQKVLNDYYREMAGSNEPVENAPLYNFRRSVRNTKNVFLGNVPFVAPFNWGVQTSTKADKK